MPPTVGVPNKVMTVFGGLQTRPNIHIQDMVNVYRHILANPNLPSGAYNAGFENISIEEALTLESPSQR